MIRSSLPVMLGLAAIALASGCATTREVTPPAGVDATQPPAPIDKRMSIVGYTTQDDVHHEWVGTVEPAGPDSLLFVQREEPQRGLTAGRPGRRRVLATSEVVSIAPRNSGSAALVAAVVFGTVLVLGGYIIALGEGLSD